MLTFFMVLTNSCSSNQPIRAFEREKYLFNYLTQIHKRDIVKDTLTYIVIFQDACGACTIETVKFSKNYLGSLPKGINKFVICSELKEGMLRQNLKDISNTSFLIDNSLNLGRYGLRFSSDHIFKIKNGRVTNWSSLPADSIKLANIAKKLAN